MLIPVGSVKVTEFIEFMEQITIRKMINQHWKKRRTSLSPLERWWHLSPGGRLRCKHKLTGYRHRESARMRSFHGCEQETVTVSVIFRAKQQRWLWMWSWTALRWGWDGLSSHISNLKDFSISAKFISACERWKKSALASRNVCDVHEFGLWQTAGESEVF